MFGDSLSHGVSSQCDEKKDIARRPMSEYKFQYWQKTKQNKTKQNKKQSLQLALEQRGS